MQIILRNLIYGACSALDIDAGSMDVGGLKKEIEISHGIPMDQQVLTLGSRMIHGDDSLKLSHISGFSDHCNITVTGRLLGGKPVKVKMMTNHLPCGSHVTIDIEEDASKDEIKMKLAEATGVPVEHQKVMLSGINQIVMGDKRTNIGYSSCGHTNSVQLAVEQSK